MSDLALFLLGPPRIERDGEPIEIRRRKAMALLAYLAVTESSHSRDALATLFWPELDQSRARAGLRRALAALKKALGEGFLDVGRETAGFNPSVEVRLDVGEFQDRLAECRTHGHPQDQVCPACLPLLAEAATLYRDDFLAGFTLPDSPAFDEWQFFQTEGLRDALASALERLARGHSDRGEYEQAIAYARRWLALDPLHEPAHRCLMELYARSGQRAAALRQYAECERVLQEELGVPPEEETAQVYRAIKEHRERALADSRPERYRLEEKISDKGTFGEVWLATDTRLDRPVAVKCPKVAHDPAQRERFVAEARMLARLNHPNITQIYDALFDEGEDRFYLVMEYVDGQDLAEIMAGGTPLPLDIVLQIAKGVLRALSYAHGQGVVHRDVKPDNVMIADDVKLTDFGLANLKTILQSRTDFMAGTLAYIAPEQIEGRPTDGRADLYSLGIMLFEMISGGQLPFDYANQMEILNAHLHTAPPPISQFAPTVPPALEQVIARLLAKDPEDRYPSADAVMEVLDSIPVGPKRSNLPIEPTPFVGREAVLAEIADRLQDPDCRLLTLVGPGGSGKTRLALEAAADILSDAQLDKYTHGVWFVSLAALQSVEAIVPTVAEALGFAFYTGAGRAVGDEPQQQLPAKQQLLDYLHQKSLLLIMDNFEHLLEGAGLVTEILKTAPEVKILATSRARLNVGGEHRFHVGGMNYPGAKITETRPETFAWQPESVAQYSAVKLFLQGARRAQPSFELTDENVDDVVAICRLVNGMPLGIRLAAAWVEMLTPAEITAEIGQSLDFLETDRRDVPQRQRSMRAVFDHSWHLLTARSRAVMQALSVFRGGFFREAAQQITGTSLRELMVLATKSLLYREPGGRYGMHELLRGYATEKLEQSPAAWETAHEQHCAYYAAALQRWDTDLKGPRQQAALSEIEADIGNARTAWSWAVEQGRVVRLNQALEGLCCFYEWRGRCQEGEVACRTAAGKVATAASGDERRVLAKILRWQGAFGRLLGRIELASQLLQQSLALLGQLDLDDEDAQLAKAYTLLEMGHLAAVSHGEEARQLCNQSLALFQAVGDRWGTAQVLHALGEVVAWHWGAYGEAKRLYEESLAIRQGLGDQRGIAISLEGLSFTAMAQGQLEEGERLARQSLAIHRKIGDRTGIADGYTRLGIALHYRGEYADAHTALEESIALYNDLGVRDGLALAHSVLGYVKCHLGQYEEARAHLQMGLVLSRESDYRFGTAWCLGCLGSVALVEGAVVEAQQFYRESLSVSQEMGQREMMGTVLACLGSAALGLGDVSQAKQHLHEALQLATERGFSLALLMGMSGIALLLAVQGEKERAVELYALASRYGLVANSRPIEDVVGRYIAAVAATLPPDVVAAAQERGRARDLDATVAELLVELGEQHDASGRDGSSDD